MTAGSTRPAGPRRRGRQARTDDERKEREGAILAAALEVFTRKGFAATRIDDVADRAGIAKGTIYLYFASKDALFEGLIRSAVAVPLGAIEAQVREIDMPIENVLRLVYAAMTGPGFEQRRKILLLMMSEAQRFPSIAEFYHREVISRGMQALRLIAARARMRGDIASDAVERFPQLVIAPLLTAVVWDGLFGSIEPVDAQAMLSRYAHIFSQGLKGASS